jgi:hypothetical protein
VKAEEDISLLDFGLVLFRLRAIINVTFISYSYFTIVYNYIPKPLRTAKDTTHFYQYFIKGFPEIVHNYISKSLCSTKGNMHLSLSVFNQGL